MTDTDDDRIEYIEERAAIFEYDAGFSRYQAERMAKIAWDRRQHDRMLDSSCPG